MARRDVLNSEIKVLPEDDIDLSKVWLAIWSSKLWIIASIVFFTLIGGYYTFKVKSPMYLATSTIEFTPTQTGSLDLASVFSQSSMNQSEINTRLQKLTSREMVEALVRKENLTSVPELNPNLRDTQSISVHNLIRLLTGSKSEARNESQAFRETVGVVRSKLIVENPRDTYLFNISFPSQNPNLAALIANSLSKIYIEAETNENFKSGEQSISWISGKVEILESQIKSLENDLAKAQAGSGVVNDATLESLNLQLNSFRERIKSGRESIAMQQEELERQKLAAMSGDLEEILKEFSDPVLRRLSRSSASDTPNQVTRNSAFQSHLNMLISRSEAKILKEQGELESISRALEKLEIEFERKSLEVQELAQIERELMVSRDLYQTLLTGLQETTVQVGLIPAEARLMSLALPPSVPYSPRPVFNLFISMLIGFIFGLFITWLSRVVSGGVKFADQIEDITGVMVAGEIPKMPVSARKDLVAYLLNNPTSAVTESIRNLRTSIFTPSHDNPPPKVIMVTSSVPGEGKTTISICLAANLAASGKKVILVEGDFRRQTLDEYFEFKNGGSAEVLSGKKTLDDVIHHDQRLKLDVLPGRNDPQNNAADILSSSSFGEMLNDLRSKYEYIILDTPPVLIVSDSRIVAREVDYTLYVAKWNMTTPSILKAGLKMFDTIGSPISGITLTQIDMRKAKGQYGGSYASYASYDKGSYYGK